MIVTRKLAEWEYRATAARVPLLCVDGILGSSGPMPCKFLLVRRRFPPFQGEWWPPGGRVFKGETLIQAFRRVMWEEVRVRVGGKVRIAGVYELRYGQADADAPGGRHTVSVVFEATVPKEATIRLDEQSSAWTWATRLPAKFRLKEERWR